MEVRSHPGSRSGRKRRKRRKKKGTLKKKKKTNQDQCGRIKKHPSLERLTRAVWAVFRRV